MVSNQLSGKVGARRWPIGDKQWAVGNRLGAAGSGLDMWLETIGYLCTGALPFLSSFWQMANSK